MMCSREVNTTLPIATPMTGLLVELTEADLFRSDVAGKSAIGQETRESLR
jgi:hypothetical protein